MKVHRETLLLETTKNNLLQFDSKLRPYLDENDYFHLEDLTVQLKEKVKASHVQDGILSLQVLHTTCVLNVNELDEPMLLGDLCVRLRDIAPKVQDYLHNSKLRTVNLCEDDRCDRNADAHIKSFLIGNHNITVTIADGELMLGRWQRVALIDFDGPRTRKVHLQIMGV